MMSTLKDLREQRGRLVTEMRSVLDTAWAETRDLSAEEQAKYDLLFAEQETVASQITREERQLELDRRMAEEIAVRTDAGESTSLSLGLDQRTNPRAAPEYRAAFNAALHHIKAPRTRKLPLSFHQDFVQQRLTRVSTCTDCAQFWEPIKRYEEWLGHPRAGTPTKKNPAEARRWHGSP